MQDFKSAFESILAQYRVNNPFKTLVENKCALGKKPLVLYGAGIFCKTIVDFCYEYDIKINAICDSYKRGTYGDTGLEIISPTQLTEEFQSANIVICSQRFDFADEIRKQLISLGFSETQIFLPTMERISFIHPKEFMRHYLEGYEWAYNFFSDSISKRLLLDRIRMYFIGTKLVKTSEVPHYFDPEIIKLHSNEVFVDGGAFTGDTVEEFVRQANMGHVGGYRHIYSFEPDNEAYKKAMKNLEHLNGIDLVKKGLWCSDTSLEFFSDGGDGSSTFVNGVRTITVPVVSLDSFFQSKPEEELPTYIKMDVEGAEKEALLGAKNIIGKKHPKLAISAYHKPEDIYELPRIIYEMDSSYRFTLRQCEDGIYETLLYAV